jgi:hypothetical protein
LPKTKLTFSTPGGSDIDEYGDPAFFLRAHKLANQSHHDFMLKINCTSRTHYSNNTVAFSKCYSQK